MARLFGLALQGNEGHCAGCEQAPEARRIPSKTKHFGPKIAAKIR
jgi:hypothetical protein